MKTVRDYRGLAMSFYHSKHVCIAIHANGFHPQRFRSSTSQRWWRYIPRLILLCAPARMCSGNNIPSKSPWQLICRILKCRQDFSLLPLLETGSLSRPIGARPFLPFTAERVLKRLRCEQPTVLCCCLGVSIDGYSHHHR